MYSVVVTLILLLYICWDVNYFIRIIATIYIERWRNKKYQFNDTTTIYGFCTTQDVDIFLKHMNNARYLRELDFARFHFFDRTGLFKKLQGMQGMALQGASNIRYRRMIPIFTAYKIETKILYWEDKTVYIEHKFITLRDGFVRAIILSRQNLVKVDAETLFKNIPDAQQKPECPEEIKYWIQSNESSSAKLRNID